MDFSQATLLFVVLAPGLVFAAFALLWLLGWVPSERAVSRVTGLTFSTSILALAVVVWTIGSTGAPSVMVSFGNWFSVHEYRFPLVLLADRLSLPFLGLTVVLSGLIGQFSATYLHRERGFLRFFLLLHLFAFGSLLAFAAGSFDLLAAGWEIVGITSVLLIAFFQQRTAPVENGLRVFAADTRRRESRLHHKKWRWMVWGPPLRGEAIPRTEPAPPFRPPQPEKAGR